MVTTQLEATSMEALWERNDPDAVDEEASPVLANIPMPSKDFEKLVLAHLGMLYAVALRLTRNPTDAQDLTQNCLVKVLRFHDKFKFGTYIKAWMLMILRNTFINEYRRRKRSPFFVELTGYEGAVNSISDPEVAYYRVEEGSDDQMELLDDEVKSAIESLPEQFRLAVIMADLRDNSYKEIAVAMGCPLGTVMSRLYRGRKILRLRLYDYAKTRRLANQHHVKYSPESGTPKQRTALSSDALQQ
jgi:RNA polymerase sigma-70 factor, ECF subfamily